MSRRRVLIAAVVVAGLGFAGLMLREPTMPPSTLTVQRRAELPFTDLGWVRMWDHFVATVGPRSGTGRPFGPLLVLADATFAPRSSFPQHPHREMEILSIVLNGELTHTEPGVEVPIPPGAMQVMSARDGVVHAEANRTDRDVRMLQLWLEPHTFGGKATYRVVPAVPPTPGLHRFDVGELRQNTSLFLGRLEADRPLELELRADRMAYLLVADGDVSVNGARLGPGDGAMAQPGTVRVEAQGAARVVVIELPSGWRSPRG